jgi:hypothetical protein
MMRGFRLIRLVFVDLQLRAKLFAEFERFDQRSIGFVVIFLKISQERTTFSDEFGKRTFGNCVAFVLLKMGSELGDSLGENSDLNLSIAGIFYVFTVLLDDYVLFFFRKHVEFSPFERDLAVSKFSPREGLNKGTPQERIYGFALTKSIKKCAFLLFFVFF